MRLLFIHIRGDDRLAEHERTCLLDVLHAEPGQASSVNVARTGMVALGWDVVRAHHAVVIGGSGDHSVVDDHHFTRGLSDLVHRMVDEGVPLFGSCWGHQFIARALGGSVIRDHEHKEVGAVVVRRTGGGVDDPVFAPLPGSFTVLMGHEDRVDVLPAGGVELAASEVCSNQAFRIEGVPVYGTQFHAELTPERLIERLAAYRHYIPDDREFARLKASLKPTPEAETVLARFLREFVVMER